MNELELFKKYHPAYKYAEDVINKKIPTNKFVTITCQQFIDEIDNKESDYFFDFSLAKKISRLTKLFNMGGGLSSGKPVHDCLAGFQWFFIVNIFCWKYKSEPNKRRYEISVLLIARKSGKTFLTAIVFFLLLLLEPGNSKFFSVAPDLELSSQILQQMEDILRNSPIISDKFKVIKGEITCLMNHNKFTPLATSKNRMDGRLPAAFLADEVGALKNVYPIEAMRSGQMNILNKTGILISTAYDSLTNPMSEQVQYSEEVLNGEKEDKQLFSLIYKPDKPKEWMDNDEELLKANPLAYEIPNNFEFLKEQREKAINIPSTKTNFLTKHMNIFVNGEEFDTFLNESDVDKAMTMDSDTFDWRGRDVYVGMDLSRTNDNTAISMTSFDFSERILYAQSWIFIPRLRVAEKDKAENINYQEAIDDGYAFLCGDRVVDYKQMEDFVLSLQDIYGVRVIGIAYDKWMARSSVSRFESEGYDTFEVDQSYRGLNAGTRYTQELFLNEKIVLDKDNQAYKMNFLNAKTVTNTQMAMMLHKKQSLGKIDMAASTVNTICLWRDELDNENVQHFGAMII